MEEEREEEEEEEREVFLKCPEKFYLAAAFCDHPPPLAKGITEDSRLLLFALHEQATKGPAREHEREEKPSFWTNLYDPASSLRFSAWEMLGDMPAIVAMERYCDEVEAYNKNWFQLMTKGASYETRAKMLTMADECSEEYYLNVKKGLLVPPREKRRSENVEKSSREEGEGEGANAGIRTFGSVIFSGNSPRKGGGGGAHGKSRFALESKMPEKNEWRTIVAQPMKKVPVNDGKNTASGGAAEENREKKLETSTHQRFPQKRFGHIAHKIGEELIVSHGNKDGRLLSDCWALDLMELRWKKKELKWPGSPCADAASVATGDGEIYLFRGVGTKNDEDAQLVTTATNSSSTNNDNSNIVEKMMMTVSKLDLSDIGGKLNELKWQHVPAVGSGRSSDLPCARTGHTATLFETDDVVYVFGGMSVGDAKKNVKSVPLNDLWEFSLITKTWRQILTTTTTATGGGKEEEKEETKSGAASSSSYIPCEPPTARGSHVAGRCGRFLLVFGGAAGNVLSDTDVHCFDTRTYKWIKVTAEIVSDQNDEDKKLEKIAPRAGHCATTSEDCTKMFICGGGDNQSALLETLSLDCSELLALENAAFASPSSPPKLFWSLLVKSSALTGKEGMTLTTIPCQSGEYLLAFGGLTGTSDCEVSCLRVK
jgi:hypothetical protein